MELPNRFRDENVKLGYFKQELWAVCPQCAKKAIFKTKPDTELSILHCGSCGFHKQGTSDFLSAYGSDLWLQTPFRGETLWAVNGDHLDYLERYIAAGLREHHDRTGYTMVEKLPKFIQIAKNREALLKALAKLRLKG